MTTLPTSGTDCYDNTKVSAYKACRRMYFLRHVLDWRSDGTAIPLVFGLSWHDGMDFVWANAKKLVKGDLARGAYLSFLAKWEEQGMPTDLDLDMAERFAPRTPEIAYEMYINYIDKRWKMLQECKVIGIEQPFAVPMPGVDGVWYIGRLDKAVEYNGQRLVLEHKSTTAYARQGGFLTSYTDSWSASSQCKGYQFGGNLYYNNIDGVWVDAALVHRQVHDQFKFIPVAHSTPLLKEWLQDTAQWIKEIKAEEQRFNEVGVLEPGMFVKNEDQCFHKYGECSYLDICRTCTDPSKLNKVPPGYKEEKWEPFSILGLDKLLEKENAG